MSTSLLYHAWGVRGYRLVCTRFEKSRVCRVLSAGLKNPRTREATP